VKIRGKANQGVPGKFMAIYRVRWEPDPSKHVIRLSLPERFRERDPPDALGRCRDLWPMRRYGLRGLGLFLRPYARAGIHGRRFSGNRMSPDGDPLADYIYQRLMMLCTSASSGSPELIFSSDRIARASVSI
jgi:hypothetical protein